MTGGKKIGESSNYRKKGMPPERKYLLHRTSHMRSDPLPFGVLRFSPSQYSFIWPDSEIGLQQLESTHHAALQVFQDRYQCTIRCDHVKSVIIIQGMQEKQVVEAGRRFEGLARQMISDMSRFIKISLVNTPTAPLDQPYVSLDKQADLKTCLYQLPLRRCDRTDTFTVNTPKLWTSPVPGNEDAQSRPAALARRLTRFNRKAISIGLDRALTNLQLAQKSVRMQVDFGEAAFLRFLAPQSGWQHHNLESFMRMISRDRTDLLLQR
jgi:hypothetical protein